MTRLSLRNNQLKLESSGKLLVILEEFRDHNSKQFQKKKKKMSTCNRLDLETLRSPLVMPKNLPGHGFLLDGLLQHLQFFKASPWSILGWRYVPSD